MYLRTLGIVAVFNIGLALVLAPPLLGLALIGLAAAALLAWRSRGAPAIAGKHSVPSNPLELSAAALFATLFVVVSVASAFASAHFGAAGLYSLAAIVGVTDIDPFVLSVAQNDAGSFTPNNAAIAILVATASNNVLKAAYAVGFAGPQGSAPAGATLILLSAGAILMTFIFAGH